MAANMYVGAPIAAPTQVFEFPRAVSYLNVSVASGATLSISFDGGDNFITLPAGFSGMQVGPLTSFTASSTGAFQVIGAQA